MDCVIKVKELELKLEQIQEDKERLTKDLEEAQSRYKQNINSLSNEKMSKHQRSSSRRFRDLEMEMIQLKN